MQVWEQFYSALILHAFGFSAPRSQCCLMLLPFYLVGNEKRKRTGSDQIELKSVLFSQLLFPEDLISSLLCRSVVVLGSICQQWLLLARVHLRYRNKCWKDVLCCIAGHETADFRHQPAPFPAIMVTGSSVQTDLVSAVSPD